MEKVELYRKLAGSRSVIATFHLQNGVYTDKMQGEHTLVFDVTLPKATDFLVGDTMEYKGDVFTLNKPAEYSKLSNFAHKYTITLQGPRHTLERFLMKHTGSINFPYLQHLQGTMLMYLDVINAVDPGWTLGDIEADTEPTTIVFNKVDCFSALSDIAEAFGCEWAIRGKQITVKKNVGIARAITFEYGKGNGLYSLLRKTVDNAKIVTRAYGLGGTQNLPKDYGKEQLELPAAIEDAAAIAAYDIREGVFENIEIFPQRTSTATAVGQINEGTFTLLDPTIDFDLEKQRIAGTEAKVVFKSGMLNGQEFKILSYNHTRKEIRYEANKDSNGKLTPFGTIKAEIGDKYTLVGIRMPQSYVDTAITELRTKTEEFLNSNKVPRVIYELDIDKIDLARKGLELNAGDIVNVKDADLSLDENIRITSISYPALYPFLTQDMKITAEVGNEITYTRVQKIEKDVKENKEVITQVGKTSWENDRRNLMVLNEFMGKIFDPDGELKEPLIKAIVGFFGAQSMLFDLDGVTYTENVGGNANAFSITGGHLVHKTYSIPTLGNIWELLPLDVEGLDPIKSYYLSAKCSRTALTGIWVLSEEQIPTDTDISNWHFNLGVLSSVIDGKRSLSSTKGFTIISGGQITTDSITAYHINVKKLFAQLITVGSGPDSENAGISGLADIGHELDSIRFWAGKPAKDRYSAPFQVRNNGQLIAEAGKIGGFDITQDSLKIGENDSWEVNKETVYLNRQYFLMRQNGAIRGQRSELSWNLYNSVIGNTHEAASAFNTIIRGTQFDRATNIAIGLEASGAYRNIALLIKDGDIGIGPASNPKLAISGQFEYQNGNSFYFLEFEKGILVKQGLKQ